MKVLILFTLIAVSVGARAATAVVIPAKVAALNKLMCPDAQSDMDQDVNASYDIGKNAKLFLVNCMSGAYNFTTQGYIVEGQAPNDSVTLVTIIDAAEKGVLATTNLVNADFDSKSQTLSTFAKGRGIGDCGSTTVTSIKPGQYGGVEVKTLEVHAKMSCDGKGTPGAFPAVFKQK